METIVDLTSLIYFICTIVGLIVASSKTSVAIGLIRDLAQPLGLIGFLIGLISIFASTEDMKSLGAAIAIAIVVVLYFSVVSGLIGFSNPVVESSQGFKKHLGFIILASTIIWSIKSISADFDIYFDANALAIVIAGCIIIWFGEGFLGLNKNRWGEKLLGIAAAGFLVGFIGVVAFVNEPLKIGPNLAVAYLTPLYCFILLVIGRIYWPERVLDDNSKMPTGFLSLTTPTLCGTAITIGIVLIGLS